MSSKVIYRFKSMREPGQVKFNGNYITVGDLIARIVEQRRLSKQQADFELVVTNSQTKEEYRGDDTKIMRNSRLIITRVPAMLGVLSRSRNGGRASLGAPGAAAAGAGGAGDSSGSAGGVGAPHENGAGGFGGAQRPDASAAGDDFGGDVYGSGAAGGESDNKVLNQLAAIAFERSQNMRQKNRTAQRQEQNAQAAGRGNVPGMPNRFATPMTQQKLQEQARRQNMGIPKILLEKEDPAEGAEGGAGGQGPAGGASGAGGAPGAGGWLKYKPSSDRFSQQVKQRGGVTTVLSDEEVRKRIERRDIPDELVCALSDKLLKDCVNLPCCSRHVSGAEIEQSLVNNSFVCPLCKTPGIKLDSLRPNHGLRRKVEVFIMEQKEKLEANAALDAERAAAAAEKEREQRLLEKKSYNRPDTILDLSAGASDPAAAPAAPSPSATGNGDHPSASEAGDKSGEELGGDGASNGNDNLATANGLNDNENPSNAGAQAPPGSGWTRIAPVRSDWQRSGDPGDGPAGGPPRRYDDYYRDDYRDDYHNRHGGPADYRRGGGGRFNDDRYRDRRDRYGRYDDYREPRRDMRRRSPPRRSRSPPRRRQRTGSPPVDHPGNNDNERDNGERGRSDRDRSDRDRNSEAQHDDGDDASAGGDDRSRPRRNRGRRGGRRRGGRRNNNNNNNNGGGGGGGGRGERGGRGSGDSGGGGGRRGNDGGGGGSGGGGGGH